MTVPTELGNGVAMRVNASNYGLRLRAAPAGDLIRTMPNGESVTAFPAQTVHASDYDWIVVTDAQQNTGWCARIYLTPVPAPIDRAEFIDVSFAQGVIDWARVKAAGVTHAYIRATQGTREVDTAFARNAEAAQKAGVKVGFYHPMIASQHGGDQAFHFVCAIQPYHWDMPPAIDVELDNGQPPDMVAKQLFRMVTVFEAGMERKPVLYTSQGFWNGSVGKQHDDTFAKCELWIANYDVNTPNLPRCWSSYWLWQFSSKGRVDGIAGNVDLNRMK